MTTDNTDNPTTTHSANEVIAEAKSRGCEERGEGLKPRHVYFDGSGKCCCGRGPDLSEQRMR